MRFVAVGFGIAALLATTVASAAGGGGGGSKGDTGGKGGFGPANSTAAGAAGSAEQTSTGADTSQQPFGGQSTTSPDVVSTRSLTEKSWEAGGTFETHRLMRQDFNLEGAGAVKVFNALFAVLKYSITDKDSLALSGGGFQYFLADSGEPGFRAADLSLAYTRLVLLPKDFRLRASAGLTGPISYDSRLARNITTPSLSAALSRKFGDLSLEARVSGRYFLDEQSTANSQGDAQGPGSGAPNVRYTIGGSLSAEYDMPFFRPLSVGAAVTDIYIWYYSGVGRCPANGGTGLAMGNVTDPNSCQTTTNPTTDNQPIQQSYGGEVFARYTMPDLAGFKSDLTFVVANGDPSLGYASAIHDGVVHPYLLYWNTAEFYLALGGRY
jgi:hypothetical protein